MPCLAAILHVFFIKIASNDHFHTADVQRDPTTPSFVLSAPPISSLCLDANEKIDLRAIGSLVCWSLHLLQMN